MQCNECIVMKVDDINIIDNINDVENNKQKINIMNSMQ